MWAGVQDLLFSASQQGSLPYLFSFHGSELGLLTTVAVSVASLPFPAQGRGTFICCQCSSALSGRHLLLESKLSELILSLFLLR